MSDLSSKEQLREAFELFCKRNASSGAASSHWYWMLFQAGAEAGTSPEPPAAPTPEEVCEYAYRLKMWRRGDGWIPIQLAEIMRKQIETAWSLRAPSPPTGWQSIETAPKDGKTLLISGGTFDTTEETYGDIPFTGVGIANWHTETFPHWRGEDCQAHDVWYVHKPTHWMPLPSPPAKEGTP